MENKDVKATILSLIQSPLLKIEDCWRREYVEMLEVGEPFLALECVEDWIIDHDIEIGLDIMSAIDEVKEHFGGDHGRGNRIYIRNKLLKE